MKDNLNQIQLSSGVIVDGEKISLEEFLKLSQNPSKKLIKISEGVFKTLQRLYS